jgi:hypothetical protein
MAGAEIFACSASRNRNNRKWDLAKPPSAQRKQAFS